MVLNYRAANYSGWPLSRFILYSHCILYTMQSYKKYLNYANISINIFSELMLKIQSHPILFLWLPKKCWKASPQKSIGKVCVTL